jgi:hypothetical protein
MWIWASKVYIDIEQGQGNNPLSHEMQLKSVAISENVSGR